MSERKINLEEIINSNHGDWSEKELRWIKSNMKEFGKQLLELAAENASIKTIVSISPRHHSEKKIVHKQSILDTVKQVE